MRRIDALAEHSDERLAALTGDVLDLALDTELQAVVAQAARDLELPIALVSLVLARTQFFRAHIGLPTDLAVARATDRDASFCQFVVREGRPFEVTDATLDERVPQELVERYGIRAYLGVPVHIGPSVVGSLCCIDTRTRVFSDEQRSRLAQLAAVVSRRLEALATRAGTTRRTLLARAASPALSELRNLLGALSPNVAAARVAVTDLGPLARLVKELAPRADTPALGSLDQALLALDDLREIIADLSTSEARLRETCLALESMLMNRQDPPTLASVIESASKLALHETKIRGGVTWSAIAPMIHLAVPRMTATSSLAATLAICSQAQARPSGLQATLTETATQVCIELRCRVEEDADFLNAGADLQELLRDEPGISLEVRARDVRLTFARLTEPVATP